MTSEFEVVDVDEERCGWYECNNVATHVAVMTKPCDHRWAFCMRHKDETAMRQHAAAQLGHDGEWQCPVGEWHLVGLVDHWEGARG